MPIWWARLSLSLLLACIVCGAGFAQQNVKTGAEVFLESHLDLVKGKRVGLITNQTGRLSSGELLLDALLKRNIEVAALFAPEHGVRGDASAGEAIVDGKDAHTGIPVYSLYGKTRKPTTEMLEGLDVLLYDIQDVGVRFYTYISTMGLAMEAAAEMGIPLIVLDRPNPLGGRIEGPILEDSLKSFVGFYPIPVVYGLTCGELALMVNGEGWLGENVCTELTVIPMEGWERRMDWDQTGLKWVPTSPNISGASTTLFYPATCFIEATNLSEGRGTTTPFQVVGAPFVDGDDLSESLENENLPGICFSSLHFTPTSSKHKGVVCGGIRLEITNQDSYRAVETGLVMLQRILQLYPKEIALDQSSLLHLLGSERGLQAVIEGAAREALTETINAGLDDFRMRSQRYRLYK